MFFLRRHWARVRPAMPAPMMRTFSVSAILVVQGERCWGDLVVDPV